MSKMVKSLEFFSEHEFYKIVASSIEFLCEFEYGVIY